MAERRCEPRQSDPRVHTPNHRAVLAWCVAGAQWMPADQMNECIETSAGLAQTTALVCEGLLRRP